MIIDLFIIIALIATAIGSYTDIKTLEVPDWLNYSLIALGIGGNLIFTITTNNLSYILRSLLGLILSLIIGFTMFYSGQWGGGDSKMIFGLGSLLGLSYPLKLDFYVKFLVNMLFIGAIYGLLWITILAIKNKNKVITKFIKTLTNKDFRIKKTIITILIIALLTTLYFINLKQEIKIMLFGLIILSYFFIYFFILVKIVEEIAMIKYIEPEKLTEGDWIVEDIIKNGKKIVSHKDLGISKKQIELLKKLKKENKIKKVKVKYGMPFVPSFFLALFYTTITNNIFFFQII